MIKTKKQKRLDYFFVSFPSASSVISRLPLFYLLKGEKERRREGKKGRRKVAPPPSRLSGGEGN
jgi:hypothetical protein